MSASTAGAVSAPVREQPPLLAAGPIAWARKNLFSGWLSTAVTLLLGYLLIRWAVGLLEWGVFNAIWSVPVTADGKTDPSVCRAAKGVSACWAVIGDKYRFILFGPYPYEQQWRPAIVVVLFIGLYVVSAMRRFWKPSLAIVWVVTLIVIFILMSGGFILESVPESQWGGLPITLILSTFGIALAFPLAVLVALGRRAKNLPLVRGLCIGYVEIIRGVPLISVLFMASVLFPLFMPEGMNIDKLLRAQVAIILFAAAYLAEVVRGGLQALPRGQTEAGDALGLSYWQKTRMILLPQALRLVIPPLVNTFLGLFKDTSLVLIIGIYDLLTAGKTAIADPQWSGFSTEIYLFLATIYFVFCYAMSRYSRGLESTLSRGQTR